MNNPPFGFKTRQHIASEYGCSIQTLRNKLKRHEIELPSGLISAQMAEGNLRGFGLSAQRLTKRLSGCLAIFVSFYHFSSTFTCFNGPPLPGSRTLGICRYTNIYFYHYLKSK
jgi:hypothetical protein